MQATDAQAEETSLRHPNPNSNPKPIDATPCIKKHHVQHNDRPNPVIVVVIKDTDSDCMSSSAQNSTRRRRRRPPPPTRIDFRRERGVADGPAAIHMPHTRATRGL